MSGSSHFGYPNVKAGRYFIVESKSRCSRCNAVTAVFGFALPADYESLTVDDDTPGEEYGTWEAPGMAAVVSHIEYLPEAVAKRIRALTPHYRFDLESVAGGACWLNHCEYCNAQLVEEKLFGELDGPFGQNPEEGLEAVRLHEVRELFTAWVGRESHNLRLLSS